MILGSKSVKASRKTLVKLTHGQCDRWANEGKDLDRAVRIEQR